MHYLSLEEILVFRIFFHIIFLIGGLKQVKALELKDFEKKIKDSYGVRRLTDKINSKDLENQLREFVSVTYPGRLIATSGHKKAQDYILKQLSNFGNPQNRQIIQDLFTPDINQIHAFYDSDFNKQVEGKYAVSSDIYKSARIFTEKVKSFASQYKNYEGKNIIWEKRGILNPNEVIIVVAHYDSIAMDPKTQLIDEKISMPGADDNATGVIALITLAKFLAPLDLPKTVRLIFTDMQELAYQGSYAYVKKYKDQFQSSSTEKIRGVLNLQMLGNDTKTLDRENKYGNFKLYTVGQDHPTYKATVQLAKEMIHLGQKVEGGIRFVSDTGGRELGDNIPFLQSGIPVLSFSQNWESDYNSKLHHTSNDFPERINWRTYAKATRFIVGAVIGWSHGIHK